MIENSTLQKLLAGYAGNGWKLIPCREKALINGKTGEEIRGAKTPLVQWKAEATADPTQIGRWIRKFPGCMWAVATGTASGFFVVDLDRGHKNGADGIQTFKKYCQERGFPFPKTLMQRTAGGGIHILFKMPEAAAIGTATAILPGVDVRGDGGYIIVAPSLNQDTGTAYEWVDATCPIAEPPLWLVELVLSKGKPTKTAAQNAAQAGAQAAYPGIGTPYGLKALQDEVAGLRNADQGTRNDTLNRAAVKLFALAAGGELDADAVTRELEAAALSIGLNAGETQATLGSARKAGYASPRKAPTKGSQGAGSVAQVQALDDGPMPLRRASQAQAPYPTSCFLQFADALEDIARLTNTPASMVGGTMLAGLSWLAQRLVNIRTLKYITPLSLYVLIVGNTGDGKSVVEKHLYKRIREKEEALKQVYKEQENLFCIEMKAYERELKKLDARKNLSREEYARELAALEETRPVAPIEPVFTIGNPNLEGLIRFLRDGLPYIGIFSDEGGILFGGTAFSKDNAMKTIGGLTSVWSDGPLDKLRAGDGVTKLYRRRICASLMIQPEIAETLFNNRLLTGQGYLCRQLVSWPVPMMKSPEQTEIESLPSVQFFYQQCDRLLALEVRTDQGGGIVFDNLTLSNDALEAYKAFFTYIEQNRMANCQYEPVDGYAKRAAEQALRIAGCLSMGLDPARRVIPLEIMEAGITIAQWYLDEVLRITLDDMASPEVLQAEKLLAWLHGRRIVNTAIKQIAQYGPNSMREKRQVEPIIDLLVDHGWLVPLPEGGKVMMGSKETYARQAWKVVYAVPDKD